MGRSMRLNIKDITLKLPSLSGVDGAFCSKCFEYSIETYRCFNEFLEFRNTVPSLNDLITTENIDTCFSIKNKLDTRLKIMNIHIVDVYQNYETYLLLMHKYFISSLTFPFLLVATKNYSNEKSDSKLLMLIESTVEASMKIIELSKIRKEKGFLNLIYSPDLYFLYQATLCLVTASEWLKKFNFSIKASGENEPDVPLTFDQAQINKSLIIVEELARVGERTKFSTAMLLSKFILIILNVSRTNLTQDRMNLTISDISPSVLPMPLDEEHVFTLENDPYDYLSLLEFGN